MCQLSDSFPTSVRSVNFAKLMHTIFNLMSTGKTQELYLPTIVYKAKMSFVSGTTGSEAAQKFLEVLQSDFRILAQETKKKYPQIKEVSWK